MNDQQSAFIPTAREVRVANVLGALWAILGFVGIVLINVTGEWWPAIVEVVLAIALVAGSTVWAARSRRQGFLTTFRQIIRARPRRA